MVRDAGLRAGTPVSLEKGVEVKISTIQPYHKKLTAINLFNETLKNNQKYKKYCIDIGPIILSKNGSWKANMQARDQLHLSAKARREVGKKFAKIT